MSARIRNVGFTPESGHAQRRYGCLQSATAGKLRTGRRAVFGPGRVTYHRVMGAVLLYLAMGLAFAALFTFIGAASDSAFSGFVVKDSATLADTMIYFSFGALTGIGSGEITALHPIGRSLVLVEAMIGQLYPATLLARLVTLEVEDSGRV